jgi:3-deoxy-manno-octulosonate cytidylyltransferase (CMP-KDO synthetase)
VRHVHARASESGAEVVIATDDARIRDACEGFGAVVCMTAAEHESGTARIAEVVAQRGWDDEAIVVNLQGDEPLVPPSLLRDVATDLANHPQADMATLVTPLDSGADLADPNVVKVVTDAAGYALYFSRAPVPWDRDRFAAAGGPAVAGPGATHQRHVGLYAYRAGFLRRYVTLAPSPLEAIESLEQLRVLWHGASTSAPRPRCRGTASTPRPTSSASPRCSRQGARHERPAEACAAHGRHRAVPRHGPACACAATRGRGA